MLGRDVRQRLIWQLDISGKNIGREMATQGTQARRELTKTDEVYKRVGRTSVSVADRQRRDQQRMKDAAEKSSIAQARAAVRVEEAQNKASRATDKWGQKSTQAKRAALELAEAERRLATATRSASEAAVSAAQRQAVASSRLRKLATQSRTVGGEVARGAGRGGSAAAGIGAGVASRAVGLGAAAGLGLGVAAATRDSVGFEKQMAAVQARLLTTGNNMRRLSDFALELGAKTQFSAGQAAAAMDELAAQGFNVRDIFKVLPGTLNLAAASGTDLASAAEIQTAALRGFGLAGDQAGRVADVLAQTANRSAVDMSDLGETLKYVSPVAKATGQSFESMLAAVGLMGNVGIKGSQAGTTLRTAMVRLTNPTEKARGALEQLGINAEKLRGPKGLLPLPEILGKIVKGAKGVDKGTRNAAIATIFGREALSGMVSLVEGGPKKYKKMQDALENSSGAAKRAAHIMRNTVAGAWDNFTGSVETAAIKLTRRFLPAVKGALNVAATGVNRATGFVTQAAPQLAGGIGAGLRGEGVTGKRIVGPGGRTEGFEQATTAQRIGQKIGAVARTVGSAAATAGKQLLEAFKPALPFFQNILLPLLIGVGKGVLSSVVVAFKVLVPIIRVTATVLGAIGKVAKPFRGVFEGIGTVIGFVAAGPILRLLGGLGKIGALFRLLGAPVRLVSAAFGGVGRALGRIPGVASGVGRAIGKVVSVITFVPRTIAGLYARMYAATGRLVIAAGKGIAGLPSKLGSVAKSAAGAMVRAFKGVGSRILAAIGGAASGVTGLAKAIANKLIGLLNDAIPNRIGMPSPLPDINLPNNPIPRLRAGGLVPILAAGGEVLVDGGRAMMVPGNSRRDGTLMWARPGSAVLTRDGQKRMAAGASLNEAIAMQAPHFAGGGRIRPLVGDAFRQGFNVGQDPTNVGGILGDVLGLVGEPHKRSSKALGGGSGNMSRIKGPVGSAIRAMLARARKMTGGPYVYGGGHGGFNTGLQGYDCSGYVSNILGPGVLGSPMAVRHPLQDALQRGAGKYVTVGIRGTSGKSAHTMARIGSEYYESGGGHGAARVGGWNGSFDLFHPRGYRAGGTVGGALGRISTGSGSKGARGQVSAALTSLSLLLAGVTYGALGRIADDIRDGVRKLQEGKESKAQLRQIKRLRGALALVEFQAGKRVGALVAQAEAGAARIDRMATNATRRLAVGRNPMLRHGEGLAGAVAGALAGGTSADSSAGLAATGGGLRGQRWQLGVNLGQLQKAFNRAKSHGDKGTMRDIQEKIASTRDAIAQNFVDVVENQRQQVLAAAQEATDSAQFGTDFAQGGLAGLDIAQRLAGTADSPGGMRDRARAIQDQLLPALYGQRTAAYGQLAAANQIGDPAGIRSATLAVQQAGNDIASAMADAADLVKQAGLQAAQDVVDSAAHGTSLAQLGQTHLELEQRLAGTFESGGQSRADFIKNEIIPALNAELTALQAQQKAAKDAGDLKLADQIGEAVASKQNDVLQASLDAQETIAENTDPSRRFGGTLGFQNGNENLNDQLIAVGNGS